MDHFVKIVNGFKPLTILAKRSIFFFFSVNFGTLVRSVNFAIWKYKMYNLDIKN